MDDYRQLLENNQAWAEQLRLTEPEVFADMASGQSPETFFIGCADSRVPANSIVRVPPGDMFVHRNVANLVHNADMNILSSIEYACSHLKVKRIIVCGHTECGGVKAAMQARDYGVLDPWLRNIRDVYRLHALELDGIQDDNARYNRLVELNVEEQCLNVMKYSSVQSAMHAKPEFSVHGWVFDVKTCLIKDLNIDFEKGIAEFGKIYDLTGQMTTLAHQS